jgi:heme-degrading monooxygenase HmoA
MEVGPRNPLVCIRSVEIPPENEAAFFDWIQSNKDLRQRYGIIMERILKPNDGQGEWMIITIWESETAFNRWLIAPEKPAVDASTGHGLVKFGKIKKMDTVAGY